MTGRKFNFSAAETPAATAQDGRKDSALREIKKDRKTNKTADTEIPEQPSPRENLTGKAGTLSKKISTASGPKAFDFRFVPRSKLQFYEENEYAQENIESLAEKILDMGLIHNLEVFYVLDTDCYIIDSGERRCRALDMLIDRYKDYKNPEDPGYKKYLLHVKQFENGYPCKVILSLGNEELDRLDLRIRHYIANEEIRDRDPAKTAKHISELNALYALRNSSSSEKININKKIGEDLGLSDRQVKKYKSVQKLIPELQKKFEENEITLTEGSSYAALSTEEQEELLRLINTGAAKKEIDSLYQSISAMKKDITSKASEIKTLENEKEEAEDKIRQAQEEINLLQEKLEQETKKSLPEQEKIDSLKKKIKEGEREMKLRESSHKELLADKNRQIELLKEQIKKQKENKATPAGYLESVNLAMQIRHLYEATENLKDSYETYKKAYQKGEQAPPSPELYRKEILEILEKMSKTLK